MKNKSKLQKVKQVKKAAPKVPAEWLYLISEEVVLRQIYEILREDEPWKAEYWEEAGVLEIAIPEAGSVDIEELTELDEYLEAYMADKQLKAVFAVTIKPEHFEQAKKVMEKIMGHTGGYFCGDTDNFLPVVKSE